MPERLGRRWVKANEFRYNSLTINLCTHQKTVNLPLNKISQNKKTKWAFDSHEDWVQVHLCAYSGLAQTPPRQQLADSTASYTLTHTHARSCALWCTFKIFPRQYTQYQYTQAHLRTWYDQRSVLVAAACSEGVILRPSHFSPIQASIFKLTQLQDFPLNNLVPFLHNWNLDHVPFNCQSRRFSSECLGFLELISVINMYSKDITRGRG